MGTAFTVITIMAVDFIGTWGLIHGAAELLQFAGVYAWEPTALPTLAIAGAVKLIRFAL